MKFVCSENLVQRGSGNHPPSTPSKRFSGDTGPSGSQSPKITLDPVTVLGDHSDVSDSSDVDEDIFDTPVRFDNFAPATPLTPPATPPLDINTSSPCVAPRKKDQNIPDATATCTCAVGEETNSATKECVDHSVKGGVDFVPPKLLRGLTAMLNSIEHANASVASPYDPTLLDCDFSKASRPAAKETNVTTRPGPPVKASPKPYISSVNPPIESKTNLGQEPEQTVSSWYAHLRLQTKVGKELEFIVPYNVSGRLSENNETCIASLSTKAKPNDIITRCSRRAKDHHHRIEPLRKLEHEFSRQNYATELGCIIKLASVALCGIHIKYVTKGETIKKLQRLVTPPSDASPDQVKDFSVWLKNLSDASDAISALTVNVSNHKRALGRPRSTLRSTDSDVSSGTTNASSQDKTKIPPAADVRFEPYQPKTMEGVSVPEALRTALEKPLTPSDHKRGFIYMFWYTGQFGHIKIGRAKDIEKRLKQWNRQCTRNHEFHKPSYGGELVEVPHVSRIERLIHVELKDHRKISKCGGCGKNHCEWFKVEERHAVAVFTKWKEWFETRPYEPSANGEWVLSGSARKNLDKVCEPVDRTDTVPVEVMRRQRRQAPGSRIQR